jgi:hypothetical protein
LIAALAGFYVVSSFVVDPDWPRALRFALNAAAALIPGVAAFTLARPLRVGGWFLIGVGVIGTFLYVPCRIS